MKRKLLTAFAVVAGLLVLLVAGVVLSLPSGSVATSDDGTHTLELAMLTITIAEEEPLVKAPSQYLGVPHPYPDFDTTDLGPDLTFDQDTSSLPALHPDHVLRAVYLGHDIRGEPYYIWHSGSPDFRRMIGQIIADFGAVGRLESTYGSEVVGDALWESSQQEIIAEMGLISGSISSSSSGPTTFTIEWHGLPTEVVAAVLYHDGEPIGWQRPVSGTAAFQFDMGSQDPQSVGRSAEMVAFTATGEDWNRHALFSG